MLPESDNNFSEIKLLSHSEQSILEPVLPRVTSPKG